MFYSNSSSFIPNLLRLSKRRSELCLRQISRELSGQVQATGTVFNKNLRIKHLDKSSMNEEAHVYDYLKDHVAKDICDRIDDLKHEEKKLILNIGSCSGLITKNLNPSRVEAFIQGDISIESIKRNRRLNSMFPPKYPVQYVKFDEESLPVKENSIDLVVSCLDLHWVNDLVSTLRQVHSVLKKDSAFIGTILGGDTLYELRSSLQLAELERLSGFSSHVSPKTTGQDIARLLQGTGFQLITVDISEVKICYPSIYELMFDLQGMGENNSSVFGSKHMNREVLQASAAIYQYLYGSEDIDKGVPATFQVIHFIGWKDPIKATQLKSE